MHDTLTPVTISRYSERYIKCASCRSDARFMIFGGYGVGRTTTCHKHLKIWVLRHNDLDELNKWRNRNK